MDESTLTNQPAQSTILRLFQNFAFLVVGRLAGDVSTFVFFAAMSRAFGQEGFGQYSFAVALMGFAVIFVDFGLYNLSIKNISRHADEVVSYYGRLFALRLIFSTVVLTILLPSLLFLPYSSELKMVIALIGIYQITVTLVDGFGAVFLAREDAYLTSALDASLRLSGSLIGIGVILAGGEFLLVMAVLPIVAFVHVWIAYGLVVRKYGHLRASISRTYLVSTLRETLPYGLHQFLFQLTIRVDVVLIGVFLGTAASGVYNAAYRVVFMLMFLSSFVGLTLFPLASKLYVNSHDKLRELYNQALRLIILIGLPASAGLWLIAPALTVLIFGPEFVESIPILKLLAWLVLLVLIKNIMEIFLTACDRQVQVTRKQGWIAVISVVGNLLLIPFIGITGAAIVRLLAEFIQVLMYGQQLQTFLGPPRIFSRLLMGGVATLAFIIPLTYWDSLSLFVMIPAAAVLYSGVLLLFKDFRENEFQMLMDVVREGSAKLALAGRKA